MSSKFRALIYLLKRAPFTFIFLLAHRLCVFAYRRIRGPRYFTYRNIRLSYVLHPYILNNERSLELSLTQFFLSQLQEYKNPPDILEVGNVLSTYFELSSTVVDKYEKAPGVINQDIVAYHAPKKYDFIVSISTLEHVGWDEPVKEKNKILDAIRNIKSMLKEDGLFVATMPIGYNADLDDLIKSGRLGFTEQTFFKRVSRDNRWKEVLWEDVKDSAYGYPYECANAIILGVYKNKHF